MGAIDPLVQVGIPIAVVMSVVASVWALLTAIQTRTAIAKIEGNIALMQSNIATLQADHHKPYPNIEQEMEELRSNDRSHEQSLASISVILSEIKHTQESQYSTLIKRTDNMVDLIINMVNKDK